MDLAIIEDADVDEHALLLVSGSLDLDSRAKLVDAAHEALGRDDVDGLVLDLAKVSFLDSTGIGALVELARDAEDRGRSFAIRNPSPRAQRVLEVVGLGDTFGGD